MSKMDFQNRPRHNYRKEGAFQYRLSSRKYWKILEFSGLFWLNALPRLRAQKVVARKKAAFIALKMHLFATL